MRSALPPGFIAPCLPIASERCKSGPAWVHEIKHDGYRLIARRTDDRVRLYTRRGFNWADRYPRIIDALRSIRARSVTIDGEAVVCGTDGRSDFDKLHSGAHDAHVFLYAFDLIEFDGEDLRPAALELRKSKLEKLLAHSDGIRFSEHLDGEGAIIFAHACKLGLEGIVSKRRVALSLRPVPGLGQGEEPREPGGAAHPKRDVVRMSAIGEDIPSWGSHFARSRPHGFSIGMP